MDMKTTDIATIERLSDAQNRLIDIVETLSDQDYRQQFHQELSPLGWHLGHCLYIENFWLHETLCDDDTQTKGLDKLYIPELSPKPERGKKLPDINQLIDRAKQQQHHSRQLLQQLPDKTTSQTLLKDNYIQDFIIQHYDQHYETMQMILLQRALKANYSDYQVTNILSASSETKDTINIAGGSYWVGSDLAASYDNERPRHNVSIERFSIAKNAVSNQQFLAFMHDQGYQNKRLWSEQGWHWLQQHGISSPLHWKQDPQQHWFGVDANGAFDLAAEQAVSGISYYEACAFANWSNTRLAHEHEWEVAFASNQLEQTAIVWEWCQNRFYPYHGFKALPYDGYSSPWFQQPHFVLKGGSLHTQNNIKRSSFRNFFGPDKRHIFAGCRLAY